MIILRPEDGQKISEIYFQKLNHCWSLYETKIIKPQCFCPMKK